MRTRRNARFAIMLSPQEKQALVRLAADRDVSASALVRRAVRRELAHETERLVEHAVGEPMR